MTRAEDNSIRHSITVGLSFGMVSGIITTLGLMVGLSSGTQSKPAVLGGIIVIAVADAFSDALGIHVAEESENKHTPIEIWTATIVTFLSKFIFSSWFAVPVLLLDLRAAMYVSIAVGFFLIGLLSFYLARRQNIYPWKVILEHFLVAMVVIFLTHSIGGWVRQNFH